MPRLAVRQSGPREAASGGRERCGQKAAGAAGKARSLPVAEPEDTATVRLALAARAPATSPASRPPARPQRRKRSLFYNALGYTVEQGHLPANPANPADRIQRTTPAVAQTADQRSRSAPPRARNLLAAVCGSCVSLAAG